MHLSISSWDHQQMSGLANETAAYALLTRTLRASYADCSISHIFGPIIPATVRCGWRNRDVYLVVQTCLMQQRVVVVVVVVAVAVAVAVVVVVVVVVVYIVIVCKMCWMQHFSAFSWCLTSLGCMFGDFDV